MPTRSRLKCQLRLNQLKLKVRLGWPKTERLKPQLVYLDLELTGQRFLSAGKRDELSETICYDFLAQLIKNFLKDREFKLIENLGFNLFGYLRKKIPKDLKISLVVTKAKAPVKGLLKGASFRISDDG